MRIAVEGCGHGTLHSIYASVKEACRRRGWPTIDLLIIGGDFQAVRNSYDLNCMSVPPKYRELADFHEYYSGKRIAPYTTIFIGGNHEASSHLRELYYGGWVAPNIYYAGAANVLWFGDLRIAGLSGIWKGYSYNKPHSERIPYDANEVKSAYHVRELDVRKLLLVKEQADIGLSHDWPRGVEWMGNYRKLFKKKDLFEADSRAGLLGSTAAKYAMDRLRPSYWFSAHLHCKFAARVDYEGASKQDSQEESGNAHEEPPKQNGDAVPAKVSNADEIDLDMDDDDDQLPEPKPPSKPDTGGEPSEQAVEKSEDASAISEDIRAQLPESFRRPQIQAANPSNQTPAPPPPTIFNTVTNFLALDKCLPNRDFLQLLEIAPISQTPSWIDPSAPPSLHYDPEFLSIHRLFSSSNPSLPFPPDLGEAGYAPALATERAWIDEHVVQQGKLRVPENFSLTAPVYDGGDFRAIGRVQPGEYTNPQTIAFCELIGIPNYFGASEEERREFRAQKMEHIEREEAEQRQGGGGQGRGRGGGRGRGRERGHRGRGGGGRRY